MKIIIFLALLFMSNYARAAVPNFAIFCDQLLQENPSIPDYARDFTAEFRSAISVEALRAVFNDLYKDVGACESYQVELTGANHFVLTIHGAKKLNVVLNLSYDDQQSRFNGVTLGGILDPDLRIESWNDLESTLKNLDPEGKLSTTLQTEDGSVAFHHNSDEKLAIGSTFKLYVLGTLEELIGRGVLKWNELLPIKEELKSLPSGVMQTWPAGKSATLYEYAEKMISLSDNTATDHLLELLGREAVENMLVQMGNTYEPQFYPLLATAEMFKLKWAISPRATEDYLHSDRPSRLIKLQNLKSVSISEFGRNGIEVGKPHLIDKIEWFATTQEACKAMFALASKNSPAVRSILSKNTPVLKDVGSTKSHWAYAGYKGGSEPGVLNMTYLLETKSGQRACLAMSWNNNFKAVSLNRFVTIVQKTLSFAETAIP
jgi:Beta-lactamase enzyme family